MTAEKFHDAFAAKMKFPDFYGRNMDAWIDVMQDLVWLYPMAKCVVADVEGQTLKIVVEESEEFKGSKMYEDLVDCVQFVNEKKLKRTVLELIFE